TRHAERGSGILLPGLKTGISTPQELMSQVSTVRGPVEVADLGPTYMHEHIFVLTADVQQNYPGEWGSEDERITDAVTKLGALAAQGVRTIVDPTVVGLGRNLPRIQRVAEQVPELNIVVATGLYTYDSVPFFFYHRGPALNEALGRSEERRVGKEGRQRG